MEHEKRVVIVNGSGGVGKDAFCRAVSRYAECSVRSSIDPIKTIAAQIGWDGGKSDRDRKFLADMKALSVAYNDFPMQWMRGAVNAFHGYGDDDEILFLHIRESAEIERAAKEFDAVKVLVTNRRIPKITTNSADAGVNDCSYDYVVCNDGTVADLDAHAAEFLSWLRGIVPGTRHPSGDSTSSHVS